MSKNPIPTASPSDKAPFVTWNDETSQKAAFEESARALAAIQPVQRANANALRRFEGIDTNISVREGFTRRDYDYFRPEEAIPYLQRDVIALCMSTYRKVGIVRQVIDLMGDFGSQGIRIVHDDPSTQRIYRRWFRMVRGKQRSERILNMFYRAGNVIIKRNTGRLKDVDYLADKRVLAARSKPDKTFKEFPELPDGEIPIEYFIPNPLTVQPIGEELSIFTNYKQWGLQLSGKLISKIKSPKNNFETQMVASIPADIRSHILSDNQVGTQRVIPLDPNKIISLHYKKDDDQVWADPMIYCILEDLIVLEKLKIADLCALDGATNRIRLWKLGDLDNKIMPTEAAISKLNEILVAAHGAGVVDLIWNPAIELVETSTDVHQFLKPEKYSATLQSVYQGLGIPQTLRGGSEANGMSDNFVQIKTMVERLQYGRDTLTEMWENELRLIRKALKGVPGFQSKTPPKVVYDHMNLTDQAAQQTLIRDMVDRDIISIETARDELGYDNDLENQRINKEISRRKSVPKVSPYHDAQPDLSLKKIALQSGVATPSEVGVELDEKKAGEKSALEFKAQTSKKAAKPKKKGGVGGDGRPKNSKDKQPRKQRNPLSKAQEVALFPWTKSTLDKIAIFVQPLYLDKFVKSNVRQFTDVQASEFEDFKFAVLCNVEPLVNVDENVIANALKLPFNWFKTVKSVFNEYHALYSESSTPTMDDCRLLQCLAYVNAVVYEL